MEHRPVIRDTILSGQTTAKEINTSSACYNDSGCTATIMAAYSLYVCPANQAELEKRPSDRTVLFPRFQVASRHMRDRGFIGHHCKPFRIQQL